MRVLFKTYNTSLDAFDISRAVAALREGEAAGTWLRWNWKTSTFHTAASDYTYTRLSRHESFQIWEYVGADAGFMAQEHLPDWGGYEVIEVEGSFGLFIGSSALLDYREVKRGSGFYKINRLVVDPQEWIARNVFKIKGEGGALPRHEAIADPIVKQYDRDLYGAR